MSGQLKVDVITDEAGTGSPSFPNGVEATDLTGNVAAARITNALNASGSAPVYACRAWVNFDGTGTVAIRASGNVSSITDNGTGNYTVNFTTAMPDANYSLSSSVNVYWGIGNMSIGHVSNTTTERSTTQCRVVSANQSGTLADTQYGELSFFR
jgi:hypothetical protein